MSAAVACSRAGGRRQSPALPREVGGDLPARRFATYTRDPDADHGTAAIAPCPDKT